MNSARKILTMGVTMVALVSFAACGSSGSGSTSKPADTSKASGRIVFWGWGNGIKETIAAFEKANPGITVKYNNTGTAGDTQVALSNAVAAGKGIPDVTMLEDPTVQQFAIEDNLEDLSGYGADKFADDFAPGPWNKVQYDGKPYALPIDAGPEVFFYNKAVFDKAGIPEPPKTWDEYYQDAKKIRAVGSYITNNAGDKNAYQPFTAQAWQAGAHPWKVDGDKITINMTKDAGMKRYIDFQQKLIDEDLLDTKTANWSDDWNRALNDGSVASLTIGAWMPTNLESGAPDQQGNWRVAPLPQWEEGDSVSAEDGGSALVVPKKAKNKAAAWKFAEYLTHGKGAQVMADQGSFPSLKRILGSNEFTSKKNEYFGGQEVNKVLTEAANLKVSKFQYLPYNPFAQSTYGDSIGKAYMKQTTLEKAFEDYQQKLVDHGNQQGYQVNK